MKSKYTLTLPLRYKGYDVQVGYEGKQLLLQYGGTVIHFIVSPYLLGAVAVLLGALLVFLAFGPSSRGTVIQNMYVQLDGSQLDRLQQGLAPSKQPLADLQSDVQPVAGQNRPFSQVNHEQPVPLKREAVPVAESEASAEEADPEAIAFALRFFEESEEEMAEVKTYEEEFLVKKQVLLSKRLIAERVSRPDQLSNESLLALNREITDLFVELVLQRIKVEPHVMRFFTDTTDLDKLETSLMEQAKYHVPASIKLAQSALETAYGRRIINNNYFGIKDKSGRSPLTTTVEYYNEQEAKANAAKIVSKRKVTRGGKTLYECQVRDNFERYKTPWSSFRAHSIYLSSNPRYSPLFTQGKEYEAWADKIGSTKFGGVGYATNPTYGRLLKKIIRRYRLHLLDY